jgi:hypothetical protein
MTSEIHPNHQQTLRTIRLRDWVSPAKSPPLRTGCSFPSARCDVLVKYHATTVALVALYVALYSHLIIQGGGIPYVMDNNETFSALNHARNLWNFDFFQSFGLADEAVSPFPAAHPMVHTHQGNFPRLFSFLLFALGARTAESQIWITTFTVGLASVLMAKSFFRRLAGDLFATVATLMLITDYLLFAQWQVNTYRVWHGFFLFGALLCVHGLSEWKRAYWLAATISLYAALLYGELVFAAFVAVTVGAYTIGLYRHSLRQIVIAGTVQTLGAALGLGTLIIQLLFYLGPDGLITDLIYTYSARNLASNPDALISAIGAFYETHNAIFLGNFHDAAQFSGPLAFLRSITTYVLQVHTPFLALVLLSLATAALIADSRLPTMRDVAFSRHSNAAATVILAGGLFVFLFTLMTTSHALLAGAPVLTAMIDQENSLYLSFIILPLAVILSLALRRLSAALGSSGAPAGIRRCAIASAYLAFLGTVPLLHPALYHLGDRHLWLHLLTPANETTAKLAFACSALVGSILILCGKRSLLGRLKDAPASVAIYLACGLVGYLFVYKFAAGYVHTGYLYRLCPLLVFHVDALLALGLFAPLAMTANLFGQIPKSYARMSARGVAGISTALAIVLSVAWGLVHYRYFLLMPPTVFRFVTALKSIVQPNDGIVSNTYAVPFGYAANTWAYMDSGFGRSEQLDIDASGEKRISYVWFADRQHNPVYRRPAVFVCFQPWGNFLGLLDPSTPRLFTIPRCSHTLIDALSRRAEKADDTLLKAKLIMRDETHDLWAIYRLEWRNPPDRKKHPATP